MHYNNYYFIDNIFYILLESCVNIFKMKIIFWIGCGALAGILFMKKFPKLKISDAKILMNQKIEESKSKIDNIVKKIKNKDIDNSESNQNK